MLHNGGMCLQLTNSPIEFPLRVAASYNQLLVTDTQHHHAASRRIQPAGQIRL
jgi:hypothetical protein